MKHLKIFEELATIKEYIIAKSKIDTDVIAFLIHITRAENNLGRLFKK